MAHAAADAAYASAVTSPWIVFTGAATIAFALLFLAGAGGFFLGALRAMGSDG